MYKKYLIGLFLLAVSSFFSFQYIDEIKLKFFVYILFLILFFLVRKKYIPVKQDVFISSINIILLSIVFSVVPAYVVHNQSVVSTIITTLPMIIVVGFYYILRWGKIPAVDVEKIILFVGGAYLVIFYLKYVGVEIPFGDEKFVESKGFNGVNVLLIKGSVFLIPIVYYFICRYKTSRQIKYIFYSLICSGPFFLAFNRQHSFAIVIISISLLSYNRNKIKSFVSFLILGLLCCFILQDVIESQVNATKNEWNVHGRDNVRLLAIKAFTDEYQTNMFTRFFGNGCPAKSRSEYGDRFSELMESNGTYFVDVGIFGSYFMYGSVFLFSLLYLIFKILRTETGQNLYLKCFFVHVVLTMSTCGILVYFNEFIVIILSTYIISKRNGRYSCAKL